MEIYSRTPLPRAKKHPGRFSPHSVEYKTMIAKKVVEEGMTYREASKIFNVSSGCVGAWVKAYRKGESLESLAGKEIVSEELEKYRTEDQVKELKLKIGELYLENEMLKKALYFYPRNKKENSSIITAENLAQFRKDAK